MSDRVSQYIDQIAQTVAARFIEKVGAVCCGCDSPIERLLAAALVWANEVQPKPLLYFFRSGELPEKPPFGGAAFVYQQARVGRYRADFVILDATESRSGNKWRWMIVECDGHDFHERTKGQARHDKARDRFFQSKGFRVLRFTGSEIWADPEVCANEILAQLAVEDEWRSLRP